MRCLVIDDCLDDRSLIERMLGKGGHRATCVSSGEEALRLMSSERFDVAIVDLGMPGMSGAATLRELRQRDPHVRLLVVSGFDDRAHVMEAVEAGAEGYILKHEIGERLAIALQEVRAGESPLSARVAGFILRHVAGTAKHPTAVPRPQRLADRSGELVVRSGEKR